jgi:hypothetical protein
MELIGTVLIMIGLGIDLFGTILILYPDLANTVKRIGKKGDEAIAVISSHKIGSVEKYHYLKQGLIFLLIGFVIQIIRHALQSWSA